ncbi:hypothetical protein H9P43_002883 [Blastocladiella emersonii ATCC 22665]|nr:hypothetical protein H9P43_002883 [Blastocladiella emersonii ATCC 22665]
MTNAIVPVRSQPPCSPLPPPPPPPPRSTADRAPGLADAVTTEELNAAIREDGLEFGIDSMASLNDAPREVLIRILRASMERIVRARRAQAALDARIEQLTAELDNIHEHHTMTIAAARAPLTTDSASPTAPSLLTDDTAVEPSTNAASAVSAHGSAPEQP